MKNWLVLILSIMVLGGAGGVTAEIINLQCPSNLPYPNDNDPILGKHLNIYDITLDLKKSSARLEQYGVPFAKVFDKNKSYNEYLYRSWSVNATGVQVSEFRLDMVFDGIESIGFESLSIQIDRTSLSQLQKITRGKKFDEKSKYRWEILGISSEDYFYCVIVSEEEAREKKLRIMNSIKRENENIETWFKKKKQESLDARKF